MSFGTCETKKVEIVYISDENYIMPTTVSIQSLLESINPECVYKITIFTQSDINNINDLMKLATNQVKIEIRQVRDARLANFEDNKDKRYCVATSTALLKFIIADELKDIDKCIYLDGDTLIKKSLEDLYDLDLGDNYVAAVPDYPQVIYEKPRIDLGMQEKYFNSGVMVLNLKKIREDGISDKLIEEKRNRVDDSLMDQNVLNVVFEKHKILLPIKYNCCLLNLERSQKNYSIEKINKLNNTDYRTVSEIMDDAYIIHFSSKDKPWKYYDVSLADKWLYYYTKSPFENNLLVRTGLKANDLSENGYEEVIPVVFSANEKYANLIPIVAKSIEDNYSGNKTIRIYVLHTDLNSNAIEQIKRSIFYETHFIDVSGMIDKGLFTCAHFTVEMYYRVLIAEILPQYPKVLYLDCDIILNGNIEELYGFDISNYVIGASHNFLKREMYDYVKNRLSLETDEYINSGVLIINTKKFIKEKIKENFFRILNLRDSYVCPDQDVLSIVCKDMIYFFPYIWNVQLHHIMVKNPKDALLCRYQSQYSESMKNAKIYHFSGQLKPWNVLTIPYADVFWNYAKLCDKTCWEVIFNQIESIEKKENELKRLEEIISIKDEEKEKIEKECELLNYSISEIRKSKSYKCGRIITFIPRLIRHLFLGKGM